LGGILPLELCYIITHVGCRFTAPVRQLFAGTVVSLHQRVKMQLANRQILNETNSKVLKNLAKTQHLGHTCAVVTTTATINKTTTRFVMDRKTIRF